MKNIVFIMLLVMQLPCYGQTNNFEYIADSFQTKALQYTKIHIPVGSNFWRIQSDTSFTPNIDTGVVMYLAKPNYKGFNTNPMMCLSPAIRYGVNKSYNGYYGRDSVTTIDRIIIMSTGTDEHKEIDMNKFYIFISNKEVQNF